MPASFDNDPRRDRLLLLLILALFLFVSPLVGYWADAASPWYLPYLLWLLLIILAARLVRWGRRHDL